MTFCEFIKAFGKGYRSFHDAKTGKALSRKEDFCRVLLCSITTNENVVIYEKGIEDTKHRRSQSAFQAYYKEKPPRSLHPIAEQIMNSQSIDKEKFWCFLSEYVKNYSKEKLLVGFQTYLPNTTNESLFDDITKTFEKILKNAAEEPDRRSSKAKSDSSPTTLPSFDPSVLPKLSSSGTDICSTMDSLIDEIDSVVVSLLTIGSEIADSKAGNNKALNSKFERLITLSEDLPDYNNPLFDKLYTAIQRLSARDFVLTIYEFMLPSPKTESLHQMIKLIQELKANTE